MPIVLVIGRRGTGKTTYIKNHYPSVDMYVDHRENSPSPHDIIDQLDSASGRTVVIEVVANIYISQIGEIRIINDRANTWVFSVSSEREIPGSIRINADIVREPFY